MEQRSAEWFAARAGKFTGSQFFKLVGKTLTATAKTYILEKIVEELYGIKESIASEAMTWGIDHENGALEYYSLVTGNTVEAVGFVSYSDFVGGSPDGLIDSDGLIEIKCPFNPVNHLRYGLCKTSKDLKKLSKANYWQCVGNMLVTGRQWIDFCSFDPRLSGEKAMFILRIEKDEKEEAELLQAIERAKLHKLQVIKDLGL